MVTRFPHQEFACVKHSEVFARHECAKKRVNSGDFEAVAWRIAPNPVMGL